MRLTDDAIERLVRSDIEQSAETIASLVSILDDIVAVGRVWAEALERGNTIFFCGNGGSAGDSQHLATELVGRFLVDRAALPAAALTVDSSALTAIANDYGFEHVFERQLRGLGRRGDVLVGISTSGNSANVLRAVDAARELGIATVGFTGQRGALRERVDHAICVPSSSTPRIQEAHITVGQIACNIVEQLLFGEAA